MSELQESLEIPIGAARRLRVAFERRDDRYGHVVGIVSESGFRPMIGSVEGDASQDWPASPPLQQLHLESRGEQGHVALLVGMAGRSHWSLSVEPRHDESPDLAGFLFDAACRFGGTPQTLGSRYISLDGDWVLESPNRAVLMPNHADGVLILERRSSNASIAGGIDHHLRLDGDELSLNLALQEREVAKSPATTARWLYGVRWKSA